jgi:hypothetical protein
MDDTRRVFTEGDEARARELLASAEAGALRLDDDADVGSSGDGEEIG